jgi:Fic family protein
MERGQQGTKIRCSTFPTPFEAFVPSTLPPNPPIEIDETLHELTERAGLAIGRLDGLTSLLPEMHLFLYFYVRKEAVLSSQIEGTQSSLSDLLLFEGDAAPGMPVNDVVEVSRYVAALDHGLSRLRGGFPLSLRLFKEIHEVLLATGRGSDMTPGEFRRRQNWVGGRWPHEAKYIPPPPEKLMDCLDAFERFLHSTNSQSSVLAKAALAHVQFESIHPFLDGNGRLGRLLITLMLCSEGLLREPTLYLSLYFKNHRDTYYDLLQRTRTHGDWERWLSFFLEGVASTAEQACDTTKRILELFASDHDTVSQSLGRATGSAVQVLKFLQENPLLSPKVAVKKLPLSYPTVMSALKNLTDLGIVHETTGKARNQLYMYQEYVSILSEGTEPL